MPDIQCAKHNRSARAGIAFHHCAELGRDLWILPAPVLTQRAYRCAVGFSDERLVVSLKLPILALLRAAGKSHVKTTHRGPGSVLWFFEQVSHNQRDPD